MRTQVRLFDLNSSSSEGCAGCSQSHLCDGLHQYRLEIEQKQMARDPGFNRTRASAILQKLDRHKFYFPYVRDPALCWMKGRLGVVSFYIKEMLKLLNREAV